MNGLHVELREHNTLCRGCLERRAISRTNSGRPINDWGLHVRIQPDSLEFQGRSMNADLLRCKVSYDPKTHHMQVIGTVRWTCPCCGITKKEVKQLSASSELILTEMIGACAECGGTLVMVGHPKLLLESDSRSEFTLHMSIELQCNRPACRVRRLLQRGLVVSQIIGKAIRFVLPKRLKISPTGIEYERA